MISKKNGHIASPAADFKKKSDDFPLDLRGHFFKILH